MPIVDIFRDIVADVSTQVLPTLQAVNPQITGVHYEHGHLLEVNNTLTNKEKSNTERFNKYPLIVLLQDFPEVSTRQGHSEITLRLIIAASTKSDIKASERYERTFSPILMPIYEQLLDSIRWSSNFFWDGDLTSPPHTKIDRPFKGIAVENGNVRYSMNDKLDAIEIDNLQLNYFDNKC